MIFYKSTNIELLYENEKLKKEFNEYKFRHPPTTGEKGGKPYAIKKESKKAQLKIPRIQIIIKQRRKEERGTTWT
ncbi:hypothetical protein [Methanoplanus limicola]|uniref:hypothetical protein n=1 Tax=Methanoplanus limicola TaxID=2315 RepID=UPI00064F4D07|nr:hypothetical protein [Methanoplanus limicola]